MQITVKIDKVTSITDALSNRPDKDTGLVKVEVSKEVANTLRPSASFGPRKHVVAQAMQHVYDPFAYAGDFEQGQRCGTMYGAAVFVDMSLQKHHMRLHFMKGEASARERMRLDQETYPVPILKQTRELHERLTQDGK